MLGSFAKSYFEDVMELLVLIDDMKNHSYLDFLFIETISPFEGSIV
jgi:hypothetical protein